MSRELVLDLKGLLHTADGSPAKARQLLLTYIEKAEQCLDRLRGLVLEGDHQQWQAVANRLKGGAESIHANQIAALCTRAIHTPETAAARMTVYSQLMDAHEAVLLHINVNNMLAIRSVPH